MMRGFYATAWSRESQGKLIDDKNALFYVLYRDFTFLVVNGR
jgi:hypothetical protein